MTSGFQNFFKKFWNFFVLLVILEIFSHYPNIDSFHCPREDVQWIIDKFSGENGLNCFETFFLHISTDCMDFTCIGCCFYSQWPTVMSYWWPKNNIYPCRSFQVYIFVFSGFHWKLLNLMALLLRFLKNFVVLMYMFIFVDCLRWYC